MNLACANRVSEYHVLGGDSGAPVWTGNTILGVMHGMTDQVVFTNISDDAKWIQNFADSYVFPSLGNLFRSWKGGKEAAKLFGRSELSG